ncbi:flavin-containing monooxygenase [Tomitella fengzijianii]|uniref:NAD(P)/FAD-dependent oxidoreductase n=1 Tax=Tomitella fengzijianii TaxID=2597660 RepID=A0A516X1N6_9ACTN|nr:NAD(P)/FAD-dependent oxidoreductase [Tomitella fengzijianii]QDQ96963.1 NAD(P)/FAD-dependent oxidoreductase [Tomitella fengzijianii]
MEGGRTLATGVVPEPGAGEGGAGEGGAARSADGYGFAIIGAGLGGLAVAMELARSGRTDFVLLERAADVGGVWRDNTYPGAACDVPSPYYSFSYEPEPDWPRRYSEQPDILAYIRRLVDDYGLRRRIRFGAAVTAARFDEGAARWDITLGDGEVLRARFLVPAVGQLSTPMLPPIPGIASFSGPAFHSARWRHDVDLAGKRVAVVGTGASAVQFIPHVQRAAAHLTVFQRSAPYLLPRLDRAYGARHRRLFRAVPATLAAERLFWWCFAELWTLQMKGNRAVSAAFRAWSALHRRRGVRDRRLRDVLTPDYRMGCKRVLFSSDYYPAVSQPDVTVEADDVVGVTPSGITTASGAQHSADVIIFGTGFRAQEFCTAVDIRGTGGAALAERWADGARAYLGIAVPGFPNLLLMYGPNTNLGSGSILFMLERQAVYIRRLAELADAAGADAVDVRPDVEARFDADVQRQLAHSAWTGCDSWYVAESGRIVSNWPDTVSAYRRITSRVSLGDYTLIRAGQPRNASGRSRLDSRII